MKINRILLSGILSTGIILSACGQQADGGQPVAAEVTAPDDEAASTEGAAAESAEPVKAAMTVWGPQEDQSEDSGMWLQSMCEQFAAAHPDWEITFDYAVCPESDARTVVGQDPEGAADVYFYANDNLPGLLAANAVARLGGETVDYVTATNSPEIVDTVMMDDSLYGVPFTGNTWFMYYDKSVFTEEEIQSLDLMLEKGKVSYPIDNSWFLPAFFFANDCTLFGDGSDVAAGVEFGGANGKAASDYIIDLVANPNLVNDRDGSGLAGLRDGSVNAMFSGTWSYEDVKELLGENIGVSKLPTITVNGSQKQLRSFAGSKAIGVNPNSDNMQVAVALALFLGSEEAQKAHYDLRNIIPTNETLLANEEIASDPVVMAQNETISQTSVLQPFAAEMNNFWGPIENYGKAILNKEVTHENSQEMVDKLNESVNQSAIE